MKHVFSIFFIFRMFFAFLAFVLHLFRYSGAGDELISPVYIAPTLPPYVERTWPDDQVTFLKIIMFLLKMIGNLDDAKL